MCIRDRYKIDIRGVEEHFMGKSLYIAEKPSVAQEFAKALKLKLNRKDGYLESEEAVVTWCVGHLVTMSYPEEYDPSFKSCLLYTSRCV